MELIDELLEDAKERMAKSVESSRGELATVRTGRASPHLLDRIIVDYYGTQTPLKQLANVAASDARLLTVTPFDKGALGAIEKAIQESDVGLTPSNDGNVIRLQIPEMTEERRREMVKVVHGVAEEGRVAIRNVRRDIMHDLRELKKEGEAGEDDERRAEAALQKQTDEAIGEIDALLKGKEEEILEVVTVRSLPAPPARYVAIITDGNGRWASSAGCRSSRGTGPAPTTVKARLRDAVELGIEELTVFSFSTENWSRPERGGRGLMRMFGERIDSETPELDEEGVRMRFIGRRGGRLRRAGRADGLGRRGDRRQRPDDLFVAFNYGGRAEIVDAARALRGGLRGGVPQLPLRARDARPRPADPDQRRAAALQLPALAVRLLGAGLPRRALARLRPRRARGCAARVRDAPAPLRGAGVRSDAATAIAVASRLQGRAARCRRSAMRG